MSAGGDQVGDVAGGLALAFDDHGLHGAGVAWENLHGNSGNDFGVSSQQLHLAALDQGIVARGHITYGITLVFVSVVPFAFLDVVLGFRKCGGDFVSLANGVPSAVVEVQVGVDDDVDVVRGD